MTWCQEEWPSLTANWCWRWQWGEQNPEQRFCCLALPTGLTSGPTTCGTNTEPIVTWFDRPVSTAPSRTRTHQGNRMRWVWHQNYIKHRDERSFFFFLYSSQTIISGAKLSRIFQSQSKSLPKNARHRPEKCWRNGCLIIYTLQCYSMLTYPLQGASVVQREGTVIPKISKQTLKASQQMYPTV